MQFEPLGDGTHDVSIRQGVAMGRPSAIDLQLVITEGALRSVEIGGSAVVVSEGTLHVDCEREFFEETGLPLPKGAAQDWVLLRGDGQLAFLRPVRVDCDTEALKAKIDAHRGHEDEPELAHSVIARSRADIDAGRMPGFVQAYLASVFPE